MARNHLTKTFFNNLLVELALNATCTWQSRINNEIAVFDAAESDEEEMRLIARELPWVRSAELDVRARFADYPCGPAPVETNDPLFEEQWFSFNTGQSFGSGPFIGTSGSDARVACAWNITFGADVVVAVIDDGVDGNHPDLFPYQIWQNVTELTGTTGIDDDSNGYIDDYYGWDIWDDDNDPLFLSCPDPGTCPDPTLEAFVHGTPVAGIIGAIHDNEIGMAGVAPKCKIMSLKVEGDDVFSPTGLSHVLEALDYAAANGAKVANCSFIIGGKSSSLEAMLISSGELGMLVVAAAGNDGHDIGEEGYYRSPAVYASTLSNVISVASTFASDQICSTGACGYNSNYSNECVSLAAPGYQLWTTARMLGSSTGYELFEGTSGATPIVSGVAALVFAEYPTLTPAQVKSKILGSVRTVSGHSAYTITGGVVDAAAAVEP